MKQFVSQILNSVLLTNNNKVNNIKSSSNNSTSVHRVYYSVLAAVGTAGLSVLVYHFSRMGQSLTRSSKNTPDSDTSKTSPPSTSSNGTDTTGKTSLLQLSMEGNIDSIKTLISQHTDATSSSSNGNDDQTEKIQRFVNESDGQGNTALIGAIFAGHLSIVQYLLNDCGADMTLKNGLECSPLWIAAGYGHGHILTYLMEYSLAAAAAAHTDNNDTDGQQDESSRRLMDLLRDPNNTGDTPLLAAVSKGHFEVCRILLEAVHTHDTHTDDKATSSCAYYKMLCDTNKTGDTPLGICVGCGHDGPLLNLLLDWEEKQPPRPSEQSNQQQQQQQRPLNATNNNGLTPLLVACERNSASTVEELILRRDASTLICDENGRSPLAVAAFCGCEDVVRMILSLMPTTTRDNKPSTNIDSVDQDTNRIVVGHEMIDHADKLGCTPLWLAARTGNAKMAQILVEAGADVTIQNNGDDGFTPENVAIKFKKEKVNAYFRELAVLKSLQQKVNLVSNNNL